MTESGQEQAVVIVDDHPLLRVGLEAELRRAGLAAEVVELAPPADLVAAITARSPRCVVLDLGLPLTGGGAALIPPLVAEGLTVAVLTGETDSSLLAACASAGAAAVLAKSEPLADIVDAVRRISTGEPVRPHRRTELLAEHRRRHAAWARRMAAFQALSAREETVLAGLMAGLGPTDLAERDYVSIETVRSQIKSVLRKLGVGSQLKAVALAHAVGWSPTPSPEEAAGHGP